MRRVLGGDRGTVGIAAALYFSQMPINNDVTRLFEFRDAANAMLARLVLQTTGTLSVLTLGGGRYTTAVPVVVAEAYQHLEMMVHFHGTAGWFEVRVNGVTVLSVADINTGSTQCAQVAMLFNASSSIGSGLIADMDDLFCYDDTGSFNNTFIGDRRVITLFPDADTIEADWSVVGAADGFAAINQAAPDSDTTYISSTTPGEVSEFTLQNLPAGISNISAVVAVGMMRKTEAGVANVQMSAVSGAAETPGADRPVTERYTYWQDVFETDPASAAPFTPAEVDALRIKFERTA